MLMSTVLVVFTCVGGKGRKRGQWGLSNGTKNGSVDSERGASKCRGSQPRTRATIQVRGLFLILNIHKHPTR
jgi:hypothetical protein